MQRSAAGDPLLLGLFDQVRCYHVLSCSVWHYSFFHVHLREDFQDLSQALTRDGAIFMDSRAQIFFRCRKISSLTNFWCIS